MVQPERINKALTKTARIILLRRYLKSRKYLFGEMPMSLKDWEKNGWLKPHSTNRQEIQNLLEIVERDLQDSKVGEISYDWRFAIAYNAALQCCTIALHCLIVPKTRVQ